MSELPRGWAAAELSDAVALRTGPFGSTLHQSDYVTNGVPLVNPMHIVDSQINPTADVTVTPETVERLNDYCLKEGDLVLAGRGEMGRSAVVRAKESGWLCGTGSLIVRPDARLLGADFLQRFLSCAASVKYLLEASVGSTMANLNQQHLLSMRLRLPPRAEQTRIVAKLEELLSDLDAGVAELKAAQKKLAQYRQSLLKAAVEGTLTAEWRAQHPPTETGAQLLQRILAERRVRWEGKQLAKFKEQGKTPPNDWQKKYPEPVQPNTNDLPELPEGWVWASGEQLCEFITKGTTPPKALDAGGKKTIPFLRVTNLTDRGELDLADEVFVSGETHRGFLARSAVYPGDVLMNIVGPPLGQVAVVPSSCPEWNINQAIAIFRSVEGVLPWFVCRYLLSPAAKRWLKARSKTTAGQTNLTLEVCHSLPFPLPPQDEQQSILANLEMAIHSLVSQGQSIDLALKQSTAQRQNILRAAFAGQLLPQDPSDEPASVLLARIRAERAARDAVAKPRGRLAKEAA